MDYFIKDIALTENGLILPSDIQTHTLVELHHQTGIHIKKGICYEPSIYSLQPYITESSFNYKSLKEFLSQYPFYQANLILVRTLSLAINQKIVMPVYWLIPPQISHQDTVILLFSALKREHELDQKVNKGWLASSYPQKWKTERNSPIRTNILNLIESVPTILNIGEKIGSMEEITTPSRHKFDLLVQNFKAKHPLDRNPSH